MSRSVLIAAVLSVFGAAVLNADAIDPYIHIGDPPAGTPVGTTFSMVANAHGGGVFYFVNASDVTFTSLDFFVTLPNVDFVQCIPQPFFATCAYTTQPVTPKTSLFDIGAESGPGTTGITPGTTFDIILNYPVNGQDNLDPNGYGGWGPGNTIDAIANLSTPEPTTWGLFASGLCAVAAFARKRRV